MELMPVAVMFLVYGAIFGLLVYFVIKRMQDKEKEDFEKRDH